MLFTLFDDDKIPPPCLSIHWLIYSWVYSRFSIIKFHWKYFYVKSRINLLWINTIPFLVINMNHAGFGLAIFHQYLEYPVVGWRIDGHSLDGVIIRSLYRNSQTIGRCEYRTIFDYPNMAITRPYIGPDGITSRVVIYQKQLIVDALGCTEVGRIYCPSNAVRNRIWYVCRYDVVSHQPFCGQQEV